MKIQVMVTLFIIFSLTSIVVSNRTKKRIDVKTDEVGARMETKPYRRDNGR